MSDRQQGHAEGSREEVFAPPVRDVYQELGPVLGDVACPCSTGLNREISVMDMGIVTSAHEEHDVLTVTLQLTEPACIFGLGIAERVKAKVAASRPDLSGVRVRFEYGDDVWTEDRLSPRGRRLLALRRAQDTSPSSPLVD
jgi:metal-sulfur cluster biosynthetic enzyme